MPRLNRLAASCRFAGAALACGLALCTARLGAQTYTFTSLGNVYATPGVALDANGAIYATTLYSHTILRISPTGGVTVIAGSSGMSGSVDGTGSAARFFNPRALAADSAGNLFVADSGNHTIRKVTPDGVVTTLAGQAGVRAWDEGTGSAAHFDSPQGIAVDAAGNVYVADTGSRTIRKITPAGVVTTLAGLGYVAGAIDATGLAARFDSPQGVGVDTAGNVYVADTNNHAIRKITPAGVTTTIAGSLGNRGTLDGLGGSARFDSPQGLTIDAAGNLFVADTNNYLIRKIASGGVVTTLGGLAGVSSESSGIGSAARFGFPRGIAVAANGTLYISDSSSLRLGTPSSQIAIVVQPQPQSVGAGSTATFTVTATGAAPLGYQWQKDGAPIAGATTARLSFPSVQAADTGSYTVAVTNSVGTVTSSSAALTVLSPLPNDNFANAQVITGSSGQTSGNNNGATGEDAEPTHVFAAATASSVWYRWTPTQSGTALFDLGNYSFSGAVYKGSPLATLVRVTSSNGNLRMGFAAAVGTTYYIAIGSNSSAPGSRGNFSFSWRILLNDAFENAETLSGDTGTFAGNNSGATGQLNEPVHLAGSSANTNSLWYRWTPTRSGVALFTFAPGNPVMTIAAYTGSSLDTLVKVGAANGTLAFVATAGTTYSIAVGTYGYGNTSFIYNWSVIDTYVVASSGGGTFPTGSAVTYRATVWSFVPVRYQWLHDGAPVAGATTTTLALANVQTADAGTYVLEVANDIGGITRFTFPPLIVLVPPANDNFANAQPLTGLSGSVSGSNVNATGETGEPAHWNVSGTASSIWYRWTPASSGLAAIDTVGSTFDTVLAVYTGTTFANLTRLVQDDDRGGGRTSQVTFAATAGTTYFIAVGGSFSGSRGSVTLGWQLSPVLAIATPPLSQTVAAGGSATFSVQATGTGVTYQWRRNGEVIPGATNSTLTLASVQGGSDASYTVTIANSSGSVTSAPATLAVAAPSLTTLSIRNARAGGSLLWAIAANDSTLIAVGNAGAIVGSNDNGRTWTSRISGTTNWLVGVTFGAGQFVAVGDGGLILLSPDGVTWTPAPSSGTTQRLNNVLFADGKFVAVGEGGTIVTSTDARVWTPRASTTTNWLHGLAYNASIGHFAASGQGGVFLYSPDGLAWSRLPISGLNVDLEATVAVDSYAQFVAIGQDGVVAAVYRNQLVLKTGETLVTWSGEFSNTNTSVRLRGLTQGASALFATGEEGKVITASDHRGPWYTLPSGTTGNLLAGLYRNNALFIVGENEIVLQSDPLFSSRMINISTRGQVGSGANVMISGFVISGDRSKQVLVRAAGPTLAASFNLTGTLDRPVLTLVDSQNRTVATNTGWTTNADPAAISATAARVGAFPFVANSTDSALLATLSPGAYTALVSGVGGTTGLGIVEVYDADPLSNEGARAINISTRGVAGGGANKIIAGFVIDGASSRRVLIRAVGPTLGNAPFSLSGTLAEPQIALFNNRNLPHATAGAWGLQANADEIRGSAKSVGAFTLPDGSKDSAMLVTLLPGAWTVQVGGLGDTDGVVLVEVYALP